MDLLGAPRQRRALRGARELRLGHCLRPPAAPLKRLGPPPRWQGAGAPLALSGGRRVKRPGARQQPKRGDLSISDKKYLPGAGAAATQPPRASPWSASGAVGALSRAAARSPGGPPPSPDPRRSRGAPGGSGWPGAPPAEPAAAARAPGASGGSGRGSGTGAGRGLRALPITARRTCRTSARPAPRGRGGSGRAGGAPAGAGLVWGLPRGLGGARGRGRAGLERV